MNLDELRERLWRIADAAVAGLVPRPNIAIDVELDGGYLEWEFELSQQQPILSKKKSVVEVGFERADAAFKRAPDLGCHSEEHGDFCMAFCGSINLGNEQ